MAQWPEKTVREAENILEGKVVSEGSENTSEVLRTLQKGREHS